MLKVTYWERDHKPEMNKSFREEKKKVESGEDCRSSVLAGFFLLPLIHLENLSDLCLFLLPPSHCVWWSGSSAEQRQVTFV